MRLWSSLSLFLCTGWFITYVYRTAWRGSYGSCQTAVPGLFTCSCYKVCAIIARALRFQLLGRRGTVPWIREIDLSRSIKSREKNHPSSSSLFSQTSSPLLLLSSPVVRSRSTVQLRLMTSLLLSLLFRYCYSSLSFPLLHPGRDVKSFARG